MRSCWAVVTHCLCIQTEWRWVEVQYLIRSVDHHFSAAGPSSCPLLSRTVPKIALFIQHLAGCGVVTEGNLWKRRPASSHSVQCLSLASSITSVHTVVAARDSHGSWDLDSRRPYLLVITNSALDSMGASHGHISLVVLSSVIYM